MPTDWLILSVIFVVSLVGLLAANLYFGRKQQPLVKPPMPQILVNAKRLSDQKVVTIVSTLGGYWASELGLFTLKDNFEISFFAADLERAFTQAGWRVLRGEVESFPETDFPGVLLVRHSKLGSPHLYAVKTALKEAQVPHREIYIGNPRHAQIYKGKSGVHTSTPVIFVGPNA